MTSLVERQSGGGEDLRLVENMDDSLEAIEEILGALLDISRLDAGAMTTSISSFKMADLMRSLESSSRRSPAPRGWSCRSRSVAAGAV